MFLTQTNVIQGDSMNDNVNHPAYFNTGRIEVIDFIEDNHFNFSLGNVVKYICRAGKKDPEKTIEDLQKAEWYLHREIQRLEAKKQKDARAEELRAAGVTFADDLRRPVRTPEGVQS